MARFSGGRRLPEIACKFWFLVNIIAYHQHQSLKALPPLLLLAVCFAMGPVSAADLCPYNQTALGQTRDLGRGTGALVGAARGVITSP